jgi:cyclopropane-fatty-acyl-phospholipid synthase
MGNYQIQYLRDRHALPIVRDYMFEAERALRSPLHSAGATAGKASVPA